MPVMFCIERTNMVVDERFIRILFEHAFDEDMEQLIDKIVEHVRTDHLTGIKYKTFFVYLFRSTIRINIFRQEISKNGFAHFSFGEVYNQFISQNEFVIYNFPGSSVHNSKKVTTWRISE